jgi:hypothetical protein
MPDEQSIPAESIAMPDDLQPTASAQPAETLPSEEPAAMIDIHDAHHAASTWRDFFIHIATIVLGLIIAVSLEQTIDYFHQRYERRHLREDLRAEAQRRIPVIAATLRQLAIRADWDREAVRRGRAASVSGGFVTIVIPDRPQNLPTLRPENAAWPAAKASGLLAVLPNREIEGWDRVDFEAQRAELENSDEVKASEELRAVADRLGVSIDPGASVRVTPEERDELMRAFASHYEKMRQFMIGDAYWQGASDAAAHGASSVDQMEPYIVHARAGVPQ